MSYPAPRSVADLTPLQQRCLSWRIARGAPLLKAAMRAGLTTPVAKNLLTDKKFSALIEAYRALADMAATERRRRLIELASQALQEAITTGDPRVSLFILRHESLGRDPAEVVARSVISSLERDPPQTRKPAAPPAAAGSESVPAPPAPPREPACPVTTAIAKAGAILRQAVMQEHEVQVAFEIACARQQTRLAVKLTPARAAFVLKLTADRDQIPPTGAPTEDDPSQPNGP